MLEFKMFMRENLRPLQRSPLDLFAWIENSFHRRSTDCNYSSILMVVACYLDLCYYPRSQGMRPLQRDDPPPIGVVQPSGLHQPFNIYIEKSDLDTFISERCVFSSSTRFCNLKQRSLNKTFCCSTIW